MIFLFLIPSVKAKGASLDPLGAVLSIAGLGLGVFAILLGLGEAGEWLGKKTGPALGG